MTVARPGVSGTRGAALPLMLVLLTLTLAVSAVAVDAGMLLVARSEAQRAVDAAALAGASAFIDAQGANVRDSARTRAVRFASRNALLHRLIPADDVVVTVTPESLKVVVELRAPAVATHFAQMVGVPSVTVQARASARASEVPSTSCVKPFSPPDPLLNRTGPASGGRQRRTWTGSPQPSGDGFTYGQSLVLRGRDPHSGAQSVSWIMPRGDGDEGELGSPYYRESIYTCRATEIELGRTYRELSGERAGPTQQAVDELIAQDPDAYWDAGAGRVSGSSFRNWRESPRVIKVPLHDLETSSSGALQFSRFIWVFVEGMDGSRVTGRYVGAVRSLRLVG